MSNEAKIPFVYSCTGQGSNRASGIRIGKHRVFIPAGPAKRNRGRSTRTHQPGVLLEGIHRLVTSGSKQILVNRRIKRS